MPTSQLTLGRLTQGALETLRNQIVDGELQPGQRLLEPELTRILAVSRTPIREALRVLHSERLVVLRPGGGYVVAPVEAQDAREIYVVRGSLEGMVAAEAAERWVESERAEITQILDRATLLLDYEDDLKKLGKQFHQVLRRVSGNRLADNLLRDLEPHGDRFRHYTQHLTANRAVSIEQHRAVAEAIFDRDPQRAHDAMRDHMLSGWARLEVELEKAHPPEHAPAASTDDDMSG